LFVFDITIAAMTLDDGGVGTIAATQSITLLYVLDYEQNTSNNVTLDESFATNRKRNSFLQMTVGTNKCLQRLFELCVIPVGS
jgi:hypothetical protein